MTTTAALEFMLNSRILSVPDMFEEKKNVKIGTTEHFITPSINDLKVAPHYSLNTVLQKCTPEIIFAAQNILHYTLIKKKKKCK